MRRLKLVLGVAALMVALMAASAAPAAAQSVFNLGDDDIDICDFDDDDGDGNDECEDLAFIICDFDDDGDDDDFDCDFDNNFDNDFLNDFADGIDQDVEQEAESGDVDQSFDVSQTGDNSNQCVSTQGVANTGNAQNTIGVTDFGFEDDNGDRFFDGDGDIEVEDSGTSIDVSPTNTTDCTSEVNQAATAAG
jgi:hypothetical protein